MFLAHDKNANAATLEQTIVTQKDFSVTPNYPRFLREGDEINMQVKLNNLVEKALNGSVQLQILNADTNEDISSKFGLNNLIQNFEINATSSKSVNWTFKVPNDVSGIIIKRLQKQASTVMVNKSSSGIAKQNVGNGRLTNFVKRDKPRLLYWIS